MVGCLSIDFTKHIFSNSKTITKSLQESCNHAVANRRGKNEKKKLKLSSIELRVHWCWLHFPIELEQIGLKKCFMEHSYFYYIHTISKTNNIGCWTWKDRPRFFLQITVAWNFWTEAEKLVHPDIFFKFSFQDVRK